MRKAPPLALSGIFEQGNFSRFRFHEMCYDGVTVQVGKPMTVKEMGAAPETRRLLSFKDMNVRKYHRRSRARPVPQGSE